MEDLSPALRERLARIRCIVCDVDGVLTDGRMFYDGEGRPFRALHVRDGTALTLWRLAGGTAAIVSGLGSKAIEAVAAQWHVPEVHMHVRDKRRVVREIAERQRVSLDQMAFLGDDFIDLFAMKEVGLGVAVADAGPEALEQADLVMDAAGGHGAVRELVGAILKAQERYEEVVESYCNRKDGRQ
jgi:3-deoxy-D-manno-octulosonate 8-phosphate phosphatase (KDO 8-P phosphatase)